LNIRNEISDLEKALKIRNIEDQRKFIIMSDETQARESELLNLLKKKEKYLTNEEERQFNLLIKEQEMREKVRSEERKKIIEEHEQKQ